MSIPPLLALVAGLVLPGVAQAQPPANDDFDAAVVVDQLPFTTSTSTAEATTTADDPTNCSYNGSVWYSFTPDQDMTVVADTAGSDYDTVLSAYTGSRGSLTLEPNACNDDWAGPQSRIAFAATAGTVYHFMVATCCGSGSNLTFSVAATPPPPNDAFASAAEITDLPFGRDVDTLGATTEPGELPADCGPVGGSLWYSFTPASSGSVTAQIGYISTYPVLAVFTGSSLPALTPVACQSYSGSLTFRATAGQRYYLQLGNVSYYATGLVRLNLDVAPSVQASFNFNPTDPSMYDLIGFYDSSSDPGGAVITSRRWEFGDGTSDSACCPSRRFGVDGDYPVTIAVATDDGRTASATQVVRVRTHDVSVGEFTVPRTARAGQTKPVTVKIENTRYDEVVTVEVQKSTPTGFVKFGELTQFVPARPDRTVTFPFAYTFSPDDATFGKVAFKTVVTVRDARDAFPFDNEVISPATKVTPGVTSGETMSWVAEGPAR